MFLHVVWNKTASRFWPQFGRNEILSKARSDSQKTIYERSMFGQICSYFNEVLSSLSARLQPTQSACYDWKMEKDPKQRIIWRTYFDGFIQSLWLPGTLRSISNLLAYGFDSHSVNFIFSYFSEGSHTAKINSAFSNYL